MPEEYTKIAEGIVKGNVSMVAGFVERYISEDEPGFFVGDRERVDGDIRVHVTVFGHLDQSDPRLPDSAQLGLVDLQQLPEERAWMVVGVLPFVSEGEAWLNDLYSAMVRRMASRLVQFGFLDAPNRPRLRAASTWALSQVAQVVRPQVSAPRVRLAPEPTVEPARPVAPAAPPPAPAAPPPPAPSQPPVQSAAPVQPAAPPVAPAVPASVPPFAQQAPAYAAPSPALAATPPPQSSPLGAVSGPQLDVVLTIVMAIIWLVACGMLSYLLFLLLSR